jgi:hypothetical protein
VDVVVEEEVEAIRNNNNNKEVADKDLMRTLLVCPLLRWDTPPQGITTHTHNINNNNNNSTILNKLREEEVAVVHTAGIQPILEVQHRFPLVAIPTHRVIIHNKVVVPEEDLVTMLLEEEEESVDAEPLHTLLLLLE